MRAKALRRARRPGPAGNGRGGDGSLGAPAPGPQGESGLLPGCAGIMRSSPGPLRRRAFWRAWNGPGRRRSPKTPPPRPPRNTPKPPKPPRRNPGRYPRCGGIMRDSSGRRSPGRSYLVAWAMRPGRRISHKLPSSARSATRCTNAASSGPGWCTASGRTAGTRTIASPRQCHHRKCDRFGSLSALRC
jgi:hypothetical protein